MSATKQETGDPACESAGGCRAELEEVGDGVGQNGRALHLAAESCKSDHEIVLAVVQQNGVLLQYAAESCQSDHAIVLAA
eukprot:4484787-Amphidinium_carterae.1